MDSILTSIKKLLGITEEYEHFDPDIIINLTVKRKKIQTNAHSCLNINISQKIIDKKALVQLC